MSIQQPLWIQTASKNWNLYLIEYMHILFFDYISNYIYIYIHRLFLVGVSISSSKVSPKRSTCISKVFKRIFFFLGGGGQAKANYNVEVFSASNAEKYELLGDPRDWLLRVETEFCCICKGTFVLGPIAL